MLLSNPGNDQYLTANFSIFNTSADSFIPWFSVNMTDLDPGYKLGGYELDYDYIYPSLIGDTDKSLPRKWYRLELLNPQNSEYVATLNEPGAHGIMVDGRCFVT